MVWEISDWVLRGYWLITYMKSMLDCHEIENWERERDKKRNRRAYQDRGIWKLKSYQWLRATKILIL